MWAWNRGETSYPDNPYPDGSVENDQWDIGFDDAIAYLESDW